MPIPPDDGPFNFGLTIGQPLERGVTHFDAVLERKDRAATSKGARLEAIALRGLLASAMQGYAAVLILVGDERRRALLTQAWILNRALYEALATTLAIGESPGTRIATLNKDYVAAQARLLRYRMERFGTDPVWTAVLEGQADWLRQAPGRFDVDPSVVADPSRFGEWPTPGRMLKETPPFVSGSRFDVLQSLYRRHYDQLSELAHQRLSGATSALLVQHAELQWNPDQYRATPAIFAALMLGCVIAEIGSIIGGADAAHPELVKAWEELRKLDDEAQHLWTLRYSGLLGGASS